MELQKAVTLLQLEGEILTERLIRDAFRAKIKQAQEQAIGASSEESIKAFRVSLDSFSKAQTALLASILEPSSQNKSVVVNFNKEDTNQTTTAEFDAINVEFDTIIDSDDVSKHNSKDKLEKSKTNDPAYDASPNENEQKSSSKFTWILLLILLLGSGGASYHYGLFDLIMDEIAPVDVSTMEGQLIEGARIQGEIKVLSQRLNNGLRDLKSDLQNAQQDTSLKNVDRIETLRLAYQLNQSYIVEGTVLLELEGKVSQAQSLLSRPKPKFELQQQALYMLNDVKSGYQNLWEQFKASQKLYPAKSNAKKLHQKIIASLKKHQLNLPSEIVESAKLISTAEEVENAGQYTHALNYYQESAAELEALLSRIENLQNAKSKALMTKDKFNNAIREFNLTSPNVEQANDLMQRALLSSDKGDTVTAINLYEQAQQSWQMALNSAQIDIKELQAAQAAKKALAVKEALAAKQALVAKEALAAKQALAAKEALAAKQAQSAAIKKSKASNLTFKEKLQNAQQLVGKLVSIQGSSFLMGSNTGERNEKPLHRVNLKSFKMMEHEVTFAQWDKCVIGGGCTYRPEDKGWGRGDRPVISVSFNDITQQYIPWLNKETGLKFTLPSEAQWEYAAREGSRSQKAYSWGVDVGVNQANCRFCGSKWDHNMTAPVKSFSPNKWGLYDMHGNVGEPVLDCWHDNYNGAPNDGKPWLSNNCQKTVTRGGSWVTEPYKIRSGYRVANSLDYRNIGNGFRLVHN